MSAVSVLVSKARSSSPTRSPDSRLVLNFALGSWRGPSCIKGSKTRGGTFLLGDFAVCESQGEISVRLPRPPEHPDGEVRLWYEVAEDSVARAESDFDGGNGRFTWPEGDTEDKIFSLTILDDDEAEGDELLELYLHRYAGDGYWNSYGERMRMLIIDDDVDVSSPDDLVVSDDVVYFAADDGVSGVELSRSDGPSWNQPGRRHHCRT